MKKLLLSTVALGFAAAVAPANALPISGTTLTGIIWNGNGGGTAASPGVQASQSPPIGGEVANPLHTGANLIGTVTFTAPNTTTPFSLTSPPGGNTIGGFLSSGPWLCTGAACSSPVTLSTAPFATTTLLNVTGSFATGGSGSIVHDDGISLAQAGVLRTPLSAESPTTPSPTAYTGATAGAFTLA